jgi:hypothetical protein
MKFWGIEVGGGNQSSRQVIRSSGGFASSDTDRLPDKRTRLHRFAACEEEKPRNRLSDNVLCEMGLFGGHHGTIARRLF